MGMGIGGICTACGAGPGHLCRSCERLDMLGGQIAKLIELERVTAGRNPYDPLFVDVSGQTSVAVNFPSEGGAQIEFITLTTDTATVFTITLSGGPYGAAGKSLKINLPANPNPSPIPLNWSVPPVGGITLTVACSVQPVKGYALFTLSGAEAGRYPYVD